MTGTEEIRRAREAYTAEIERIAEEYNQRVAEAQENKPALYGPRGERLLPQTRAVAKYEIETDRMGNIIITRSDNPGKDVFLQFESDRALVYDLLRKGEKKDLDAGWPIRIKRSEPRASTLDELWESSAQPQKLPLTRKHKPNRSDSKSKGGKVRWQN